MISLKNVSCSFENRTVLQNINLQIDAHLTILGANGSGKSTLAKAICSLIEFEGEIKIEHQKMENLSLIERAKTLSYIPAKLEIYDSYITVEEFVLLGCFAYKKSFFDYSEQDKNSTQESLEFLKISHLKKSSVASLSSGEQQLTLIAQALTQRSKIIIFDEPTANLDPQNSKIIAQHIKKLKKNHQIILITHDLHLASFIETPIAFVKEKQIHYYKKDFFKDETLQELYGVRFQSMVVKYD